MKKYVIGITFLFMILSNMIFVEKKVEAKMDSIIVSMDEYNDLLSEISEIRANPPQKLIKKSKKKKAIIAYIESKKRFYNIYPDGYVICYVVKNDLMFVVDSKGATEVYKKNGGKYYNVIPENTILHIPSSDLSLQSTSVTKDEYIVNGKDMTRIVSDSFFCFGKKPWSKKKIQKFFEKKKSVLQYLIRVYRKKNGSVYDTYTYVRPSDIIYNNCKRYNINPKVVIATLQKEQSLIGKKIVGFASRELYFAMGCGAFENGDDNNYSGFDKQIKYGTKTLHSAFVKAKINKNYTVNGGKTVTVGGVTYPGVIVPKNKATYSLYNYTPHVFDVNEAESQGIITGGNWDFYAIIKGWGWIK